MHCSPRNNNASMRPPPPPPGNNKDDYFSRLHPQRPPRLPLGSYGGALASINEKSHFLAPPPLPPQVSFHQRSVTSAPPPRAKPKSLEDTTACNDQFHNKLQNYTIEDRQQPAKARNNARRNASPARRSSEDRNVYNDTLINKPKVHGRSSTHVSSPLASRKVRFSTPKKQPIANGRSADYESRRSTCILDRENNNYDSKGRCVRHKHVRLRKKKSLFGGSEWKVLMKACPDCCLEVLRAVGSNNDTPSSTKPPAAINTDVIPIIPTSKVATKMREQQKKTSAKLLLHGERRESTDSQESASTASTLLSNDSCISINNSSKDHLRINRKVISSKSHSTDQREKGKAESQQSPRHATPSRHGDGKQASHNFKPPPPKRSSSEKSSRTRSSSTDKYSRRNSTGMFTRSNSTGRSSRGNSKGRSQSRKDPGFHSSCVISTPGTEANSYLDPTRMFSSSLRGNEISIRKKNGASSNNGGYAEKAFHAYNPMSRQELLELISSPYESIGSLVASTRCEI